MFSGMGYSLVSPLFPSLGEKDHLSEEILGWIISTYSISGTILTPFVPRLIKKVSRIKLLCFATLFEAICTILYGFLIYINSYQVLIIIIFSLRIIHGCCSAIIGTLVYSLTISLADESEMQISLGNLEVGWSLGTSCGPLFASICYRFGGYSFPFIALGIILFYSVNLARHIDSEKLNTEEEHDKEPKIASFFIYPQIFLILFGFIVIMIINSFYYPCLTKHLSHNYNLSVSTSSLFFVVPIISDITILQFLDSISSKCGIYLTYSFGLILSAIGTLFIYPCPPLPKSIFPIILGFLSIGAGSAPVFIPGLVALSKNIRKVEPNIDELTANDISSAINNLTIDIGEFVGPIVGGFFTSRYDFKYCCFIIFIIGISYSSIFVLYFFINIKNDIRMFLTRKPKKEGLEKDMAEKDYLYGENLIDDDNLSCNTLEFKNSFLGNIKFETLSKRRNSYANSFRKKLRLSQNSEISALTY
jgi:MFS family permease